MVTKSRTSSQSAASPKNSNAETIESLTEDIDTASTIIAGVLNLAIKHCANSNTSDDPHHSLECTLRAAARYNSDVRAINERLQTRQQADTEVEEFCAPVTPADADAERVRKEALREISNAVNDAALALSRMDVISQAAISALDYEYEDAFSLKNHMDAFLHAQTKYSADIRILLESVFSLIAIAGNDRKGGK